jgi:hypothetical protein
MAKAFADLADLPEDDRIAIIGRTAESGQRVAFVVEDHAKADRYIAKLTSRFQVSVAKRLEGRPVKDTVSIIVTKRSDAKENL